MYIAISLRDKNKFSKNNEVIERLFKEGNVDYLIKGENNPDFPYLSEVEENDYSVFNETDMDGVVQELLKVRQEVSDIEDQYHIDDIVRLANQCKNTPGTVLVFAG